jgi:hypothetical protein
MHKNNENEELFCVARIERRLRPEADRLSFATAYHPAADGGPAGFEWGDVSEAARFTVRDLVGMLAPVTGAGNGDYRLGIGQPCNYVRNGCASPDEVRIIDEQDAAKIDSYHLDPTRYPITESELDEMDEDAFSRACDEFDLEFVAEEASLDWDQILEYVCDGNNAEPVDADDARKLRDAGYSDDVAASAEVLATTETGCVLYRIDGEEYAIENAPGDISTGYTADEAAREWFGNWFA